MIKQKLLGIYDRHYRKLMFISLALLILCIAVLVWSKAATGEFFQKGVSLKGGLTITISVSEPVEIHELEKKLSEKFPKGDVEVRELTEGGRPKAIVIEAADVEEKALLAEIEAQGIELKEGEYSVESMGSTLGASFYRQTIKAVIIAFIAMALVVFFTFRSLVPSSFVILCAASDIISTLAVVSLFGIRLSTAGIAALLMLIGYSVDTDILLTTKVLKRRKEGGTAFARTVEAMKTGLTMSLTSLAAATVAFFFSQSDVIKQIMIVIIIGLVFDLVYTWWQNAGILRWYVEKKHGQA